MAQAVIAHLGWSFCLLIFFLLPLLMQIFEVLVEQYKIMVSNNRQEGFRGVLQLLALSASVFRFDGRRFYLPKWFGLQQDHFWSQRPFL